MQERASKIRIYKESFLKTIKKKGFNKVCANSYFIYNATEVQDTLDSLNLKTGINELIPKRKLFLDVHPHSKDKTNKKESSLEYITLSSLVILILLDYKQPRIEKVKSDSSGIITEVSNLGYRLSDLKKLFSKCLSKPDLLRSNFYKDLKDIIEVFSLDHPIFGQLSLKKDWTIIKLIDSNVNQDNSNESEIEAEKTEEKISEKENPPITGNITTNINIFQKIETNRNIFISALGVGILLIIIILLYFRDHSSSSNETIKNSYSFLDDVCQESLMSDSDFDILILPFIGDSDVAENIKRGIDSLHLVSNLKINVISCTNEIAHSLNPEHLEYIIKNSNFDLVINGSVNYKDTTRYWLNYAIDNAILTGASPKNYFSYKDNSSGDFVINGKGYGNIEYIIKYNSMLLHLLSRDYRKSLSLLQGIESASSNKDDYFISFYSSYIKFLSIITSKNTSGFDSSIIKYDNFYNALLKSFKGELKEKIVDFKKTFNHSLFPDSTNIDQDNLNIYFKPTPVNDDIYLVKYFTLNTKNTNAQEIQTIHYMLNQICLQMYASTMYVNEMGKIKAIRPFNQNGIGKSNILLIMLQLLQTEFSYNTYLILGHIANINANYQDAIRLYKNGLKQIIEEEEEVILKISLANVYIKNKNYCKAIKSLGKKCESYYQTAFYGNLLFNKGFCYYKLGKEKKVKHTSLELKKYIKKTNDEQLICKNWRRVYTLNDLINNGTQNEDMQEMKKCSFVKVIKSDPLKESLFITSIDAESTILNELPFGFQKKY